MKNTPMRWSEVGSEDIDPGLPCVLNGPPPVLCGGRSNGSCADLARAVGTPTREALSDFS